MELIYCKGKTIQGMGTPYDLISRDKRDKEIVSELFTLFVVEGKIIINKSEPEIFSYDDTVTNVEKVKELELQRASEEIYSDVLSAFFQDDGEQHKLQKTKLRIDNVIRF